MTQALQTTIEDAFARRAELTAAEIDIRPTARQMLAGTAAAGVVATPALAAMAAR